MKTASSNATNASSRNQIIAMLLPRCLAVAAAAVCAACTTLPQTGTKPPSVAVADATLALLPATLPLGDEKPSAAHRARLALAEAAGAVLAGGLSLLGIDAPEHL